jgi:hypothetical protein
MREAKRRRAYCAYCGAPKVSDDHVPPRNLFLLNRTNLVTVPACRGEITADRLAAETPAIGELQGIVSRQ